MSIPKRGSRRIRVGDTEYAWLIRKEPTYTQAVLRTKMRVAIQACTEGPRSVLMVTLSVSRPDNWIHPHGTAITPARVRDMVERALAAGWQPLSAGPPFALEYGVIMDSPG